MKKLGQILASVFNLRVYTPKNPVIYLYLKQNITFLSGVGQYHFK